jgi:hypothetical protein
MLQLATGTSIPTGKACHTNPHLHRTEAHETDTDSTCTAQQITNNQAIIIN